VRFLAIFVKLTLQTNKKMGLKRPAVSALTLLTPTSQKKKKKKNLLKSMGHSF
jgi:hypothetical protein